MNLIFLLLKSCQNFDFEDLSDADSDVLAQAFMERCLDQGGEENHCREKTIEMFGTAGNTRIDIHLRGGLDTSETGGVSEIISKGKRDLRSRTVPRSECTKPHTIYYGGQCHCRIFYDFGDPIDSGCWRCRPRCHNRATCTMHRGCQCNNFTLGDGYRRCDTNIPTIVRSYSKPDRKTIFVTIKPVPWESPKTVFCRFNNIIVEGTLLSNTTVKCVRKNKKKKNTKVDISWDSITFTKQKVLVSDIEEVDSDFAPLILIVVVMFVLLAFYFIFLYKRKESKEKDFDRMISAFEQKGKL
ncbi:hypothetical protein TVAG_128780 [Trichomonas vaginalis G3]|uniref:Uncharacterized protein n=1 Tax=Trichomonas vaginalis (strain ATCC PRA-98 / G3) TaxID=412133 RepID=A2E4C9_TRIV3|nr:hypothetical protein TVAGG3_0018550 [Trichomonas vaginalis G3]EAY12464.1 hypothetical protein TVAG_128780 [Trichomonas vaginalis G3]KAI5539527.1 hypothetical protein TVAGG3_0018550 [Trichomonas vaginalis G3]|eukprot:XP_001324687.1 hypothetical protein [Trichomonas vaginalis G3]